MRLFTDRQKERAALETIRDQNTPEPLKTYQSWVRENDHDLYVLHNLYGWPKVEANGFLVIGSRMISKLQQAEAWGKAFSNNTSVANSDANAASTWVPGL